jgi:hypothetical protein
MRRLLALLVLVSCAEQSTPPPPKPPPAALPASPPRTPVDFAAYGDCRSNHDVHRRICASLVAMKPQFVAVSGDLVDFGDDDDDWATFRTITKELRSKTQYLPAPGNHDVSDRRTFEKEFGLVKPWHDRRFGDVHLFLLDSNWYFAGPEQLRWLEETAGASDAKHKLAVFHHPPFSLDTFSGEEGPVRERIHPILLKHRFCAAFCGHHHSFSMLPRDGIRYVVTAGGGAVLYDHDPSKLKPGDLYRRFHHFVGFRFKDKGIAAHVFDPDGNEVPELAFPLCEHP